MRIRRRAPAALLMAFAAAWACAGPEEPAATARPSGGLGPEMETGPEPEDARTPASETAFVLPERDLIPAGIACDTRTWTFYLGSLHKAKILAVDLRGQARAFVPPGSDGLQSVFGLRVDAARNRLWAATATDPHLAAGLAAPEPGVTGLLAWDLESGANRFRWLRPKAAADDAIHDLAVAADGTVYASGAGAGVLYRLAPGATEPAAWLSLDGKEAPHRLEVSEDGRTLYVATDRRLLAIEAATAAVRELALPRREYGSGIEGLAVRGRTLLAIQSRKGMGNQGWRIARFRLAADGTRATAVDVLSENDARWRQPSNAVVIGRWLYYVGTTQLTAFSRKLELPPIDKLEDVRVMRLELARPLRLPPAVDTAGAKAAGAQ